MTKKKKKSSHPKYKRLNQEQRLQKAHSWLAKYDGKNIVRGYRKHFAVSLLGAAQELKLLGCDIDEKYIAQLKLDEERRRLLNIERKKKRDAANLRFNSDEDFFFIAADTSGEDPDSITWDEFDDEEELPF